MLHQWGILIAGEGRRNITGGGTTISDDPLIIARCSIVKSGVPIHRGYQLSVIYVAGVRK